MAVLKQHMLTKMLSPSPSHIIALLFYFEKKKIKGEKSMETMLINFNLLFILFESLILFLIKTLSLS